MEATAGFLWWAAVFLSPVVREATLGNLDPVTVAVFDIPLFVVASAVAAFGAKAAAVVSTAWTGVVAVALAVYATVTSEAGWGVLGMGAATAGSLLALCLVLLGRVPTAWIIRGPFAFRPAIPRSTAAAHVASTFGQIVFFWGFFLAVIPLWWPTPSWVRWCGITLSGRLRNLIWRNGSAKNSGNTAMLCAAGYLGCRRLRDVRNKEFFREFFRAGHLSTSMVIA